MKSLVGTALALVLFVVLAGASLAANRNGTGQPSQTCLAGTSTSLEPGNAARSPGSPFNETDGTAGGVYAGSGANTNTPANGRAVSQYDVACFQFTAAHS